MPADLFWAWLKEGGGQVGSATPAADRRPQMIRGAGLTPVPPR